MKKSLNIIIITMLILSLVACSEGQSIQDSKKETISVTENLFMVNEKLYYGTDEIGPMGDSASVEGKIVSSVESNEIPSQNGESNFGCIGNPYTYDFEVGWIMILMEDDAYHIFYEKELDE